MSSLEQTFQSNSKSVEAFANAESLQAGYVCLLSGQSIIKLSGDDASSFLHNQLSNDVDRLKEGEARYAAYCTPKGRMLASFYYWKQQQDLFLQCSASLQPALQKRLQMFVMRAKAKLEDVSETYSLIGLSGTAAETFLLNHFPQLPVETNQTMTAEVGVLIRRADAFNSARYQWFVPRLVLEGLLDSLMTGNLIVDPQIWRLGDIWAGIPEVREQTKEQFVPQMVNFELIGGVNFRKGCYPGQEIVARSQYLGKLKRRMAIATVATDEIAIATEVFSENDTSQPCGMIVNAERDFTGNFVCLVEIKLADQEEGKVHLGAIDGPLLNFQALPYAYLDVTE